MTDIINSFRGEYRFLSNFSHSKFTGTLLRLDIELKFNTVEHFFQACKMPTPKDALDVAKAKTPRTAKTIGNSRIGWFDWDDIRLEAMLKGLRYKFALPSFKEKLLATEDAILVEGNTWMDRYWGMVQVPGTDSWIGENHLGKLLMQVRDELKE